VAYWYNNKSWSRPKIPTVLVYQKQADGQDAVLEWGVEIDTVGSSSCTKREWFKILLSTDYLDLNQSREVIALAEVKKWITDYLRCLYQWMYLDCKARFEEDWTQLEVVFAFAVPDMWPLEDRPALTNFNACIRDAGFLDGGPGHRLRIHTEAVAAATSIVRSIPGMLCPSSTKVLVLDAGGSTVDIVLCDVQHFNNVPRFTSIQAIGSIMGIGGVNYHMKLERCFRHK
ncbi:hypothetical protein MMC17_000503, partial [Xylographa soralifera]|nr:hypothetical protein [Xylographa soralifera]